MFGCPLNADLPPLRTIEALKKARNIRLIKIYLNCKGTDDPAKLP